MVRHLGVYLHPVRFKIEERLGHDLVDYIFNDRVKRRRQKAEEKQLPVNGHGTGKHTDGQQHQNGESHTPSLNGKRDGTRTPSGMELPPLKRSHSQASVLSEMTTRTSEDNEGDNKFTMVPVKDAAEMRRRASANKTFVKIVFAATSIVLSFKVRLASPRENMTRSCRTADRRDQETQNVQYP